MVVNRKPTGLASSMAGGLAMGALISAGVTLGLSAVLAWLIGSERLPEESIGYGAMVILAASALLGALTAAARIRRRRLLVCLLSGAVYYGMLLAATALFFGGQYSGAGVTALMVSCGVGLAILTGLRDGRGGKGVKIKGAYR